MIETNLEFFRKSNSNSLENISRSLVLEVYSGPIPDESFFEADKHVSSNYYSVTSIRQDLGDLEGVVRLGSMAFESSIIAEYIGYTGDLVLPLSDSIRELVIEGEGTASWFLMYMSTDNYPEAGSSVSDTSILATMLILGSIGNLGSGADMELPDAEIVEDRTFKCGDLNFSVV